MAHGIGGESPKRNGIGEALDGLANRVEQSHKLFEELELRLVGLLREAYPAADAGRGDPSTQRAGAPMTSEVEGIAGRVTSLNDRLRVLLDRLDV